MKINYTCKDLYSAFLHDLLKNDEIYRFGINNGLSEFWFVLNDKSGYGHFLGDNREFQRACYAKVFGELPTFSERASREWTIQENKENSSLYNRASENGSFSNTGGCIFKIGNKENIFKMLEELKIINEDKLQN